MVASACATIARRVEELLRTYGLEIGEAHCGPVPLGQMFEECNLRHTALPQLDRRAIVIHLADQGIAAGDLGPVDEPLSGFLFVRGLSGWAYVNATDILPRRRFTAAHELGHFILHREQMTSGYISDTASSVLETMEADEVQSIEREANQFAVELLMPAGVCHARAAELQQQQGCCPRVVLVNQMAAELLVSREAMRYRLQALEVGDA